MYFYHGKISHIYIYDGKVSIIDGASVTIILCLHVLIAPAKRGRHVGILYLSLTTIYSTSSVCSVFIDRGGVMTM
jgi:hypothetical protein